MARPERVELPTFWFVARRSIQLSYGRAMGYAVGRYFIVPSFYYRRNAAIVAQGTWPCKPEWNSARCRL